MYEEVFLLFFDQNRFNQCFLNHDEKNYTMNIWIVLGIAILAEVIGTLALKFSDGFSRLWPSVVTVIGYGVAFYCLSMTLKVIPMGISYAIWSGVGIVLISLAGWLLMKQSLDLPAVIGMSLIIAGVIVINLFSNSVPHA